MMILEKVYKKNGIFGFLDFSEKWKRDKSFISQYDLNRTIHPIPSDFPAGHSRSFTGIIGTVFRDISLKSKITPLYPNIPVFLKLLIFHTYQNPPTLPIFFESIESL